MENVRDHYNLQRCRSLEERKWTPNFNIRKFNNSMKRLLIKNNVDKNFSVLDIGVGKGGDLKKYENLRIKMLYGLDISNVSLIEAAKRSRMFSLDYICRFKIIDCFGKKFDLERQFDFISCQFAFHYCFRTIDNYNTTIRNVTRHLMNRGKFLITIPDSKEIKNRIRNNHVFNKYYKIENFTPPSASNFSYSYLFSLTSSIESCEEYLVDEELLINDMKKENVYLVESVNFADYVFDCDRKNINRSLTDEFYAMNNEEKDVISLYKFMIFQKKINKIY